MGPAVTGRPQFQCDKCLHTWTNGHTGFPDIHHVLNPNFLADQKWPLPRSMDDEDKWKEIGQAGYRGIHPSYEGK